MSAPPPPPKRKNKFADSHESPIGAGHNVARLKSPLHPRDSYQREQHGHPETVINVLAKQTLMPLQLINETPETIIGEHVVVRGELEFERLLRIDGLFTGTLISKGDLIVGENGQLNGDVNNMGSVLVDGKVIGNISVERLTLRGEAAVHGNVTCKSLTVDPTVIIVGSVNVHPQAPRRIDTEGRLLPEPEDTTPPPKKLSALGMSKSMSKINKSDALAPAVSKEDLLRHTTDEKLPSVKDAKDISESKEAAAPVAKPPKKTKPHDMSPERSNLHGEKSARSVVDTETKPKPAAAPPVEAAVADDEEQNQEENEEENGEQDEAEAEEEES